MRVIEKSDAGTHYQKSELRNDYNRILKMLDKEDKLFIDDRSSRSVAVMLSYKLYRGIVSALGKIEDMQDEEDYRTALTRASDRSKPYSSAEFKNILKKMDR